MLAAANPRISPAASVPYGPEPVATPAELRAYAFTYLFRGGVVAVAALSNYALEATGFAAPWLPWVVLMPAAAIFQSIRGRRLGRQQPAGTTATASAKQMRLLQTSFVAIILVAVVCASWLGWEKVHPLMLGLYALGTGLAGRVLRFRPLVWGGVVCGLLGGAAALVPASTQLLLIALAMLLSYVVPGYLLRASRLTVVTR